MSYIKSKIIKNFKFYHLLFLGSVFLFIFFSYWRYKFGVTRYFDQDEFMYPNWSYHMYIGYRPYLDFMMFVTPLYLILFMPIFLFFQGTDPLIIGRIQAFIISLSLAGGLIWVFWEMRKSWLAIIAGLILFSLPMPSDKLIELRPDNMAMMFFLFGLALQIKWIKKPKWQWAFFSGLFYSLAIFTLQKVLPYVSIALAITILISITNSSKSYIFSRTKYFFLGLIPISILFSLWMFISQNPSIVLYSILKLPFEQAKLYVGNLPLLFFFRPNNTYYGAWGYGIGYITNIIFWSIGIIIGIIRILYAILPKTKNRLLELMIGFLTIGSIASYAFQPPKFPQYLIPAAIFVSLNLADFVFIFYQLTRKNILRFVFIFSYILFCILLYKTFIATTFSKLNWTNKNMLEYINNIHTSIPTSEYVLDTMGYTLYYPYPHYVCCLPYAEFRVFLTRSMPSVKHALIDTKTKYIYGHPLRIYHLAEEDVLFITENYEKDDKSFYTIKSEEIFSSY